MESRKEKVGAPGVAVRKTKIHPRAIAFKLARRQQPQRRPKHPNWVWRPNPLQFARGAA